MWPLGSAAMPSGRLHCELRSGPKLCTTPTDDFALAGCAKRNDARTRTWTSTIRGMIASPTKIGQSLRHRQNGPMQQHFAAAELRKLRSLRTPFGIQRFLDALPYHLAMTAWSPRRVLRERTAHCLEAAIFGAAALRAIGFPPLLLDLEAENDTDHVLAVYRVRGHWGAVAKSNYAFLGYREPIFRTLRELALSYFEAYFNLRRDRTLRTYSNPVDLRRFDARDWMTSE